jgi:hypothetical protein
VLVLGQPLTPSLWIATLMTCVAMALLGGEWRADRARMLSSFLYGGLAAFLFATSDILTQTWVGELGMTHFAPLAFGSMLAYSWLLTPKFSQPLSALPTRALLWTVAGGALLAKAWGTEVLFADEAMYGAMVDVRVPTTNTTLGPTIGQRLLNGEGGGGFSTFVPVYDIGGVGGVPGTFYARVSAQIYTEMSDLQNLASAVLAIIAANGGK